MRELAFEVESSSTGEIYQVRVSRNGDSLTCTCTCPAGQNRSACKHRLGILRGESNGIVGGDTDCIRRVPELLVGTDVEKAMNTLAALDEEMALLKKRISAAKKALSRVMDE